MGVKERSIDRGSGLAHSSAGTSCWIKSAPLNVDYYIAAQSGAAYGAIAGQTVRKAQVGGVAAPLILNGGVGGVDERDVLGVVPGTPQCISVYHAAGSLDVRLIFCGLNQFGEYVEEDWDSGTGVLLLGDAPQMAYHTLNAFSVLQDIKVVSGSGAGTISIGHDCTVTGLLGPGAGARQNQAASYALPIRTIQGLALTSALPGSAVPTEQTHLWPPHTEDLLAVIGGSVPLVVQEINSRFNTFRCLAGASCEVFYLKWNPLIVRHRS